MKEQSIRSASYPKDEAKRVFDNVSGSLKRGISLAEERMKGLRDSSPKLIGFAKDTATLIAGAKAGQVVAEFTVRAEDRLKYSQPEMLGYEARESINLSLPGIDHVKNVVQAAVDVSHNLAGTVGLAIEQNDAGFLSLLPEHAKRGVEYVGSNIGSLLGWGASVMLVDFALGQLTSAVATNKHTPELLKEDLVKNSSYLAPWEELTSRQKLVRTTNAVALGTIADAYLLTSKYIEPVCKFVQCG